MFESNFCIPCYFLVKKLGQVTFTAGQESQNQDCPAKIGMVENYGNTERTLK